MVRQKDTVNENTTTVCMEMVEFFEAKFYPNGFMNFLKPRIDVVLGFIDIDMIGRD